MIKMPFQKPEFRPAQALGKNSCTDLVMVLRVAMVTQGREWPCAQLGPAIAPDCRRGGAVGHRHTDTWCRL